MDRLPDKSELPILNLDVELYERNNVVIAFLVVISGLIKNKDQRPEILTAMKAEYIGIRFYRYLFEIVVEELKENDEINIDSVARSLPKFGPKVYGRRSNKRSLKGEYFTLAQVLDFEPSPAQVSKAIEMVIAAAKIER